MKVCAILVVVEVTQEDVQICLRGTQNILKDKPYIWQIGAYITSFVLQRTIKSCFFIDLFKFKGLNLLNTLYKANNISKLPPYR